MSEKPKIDDIGQALIEAHFAYKHRWLESRLFICEDGHLRLCSSQLGLIEDGAWDTWTCSRGGPDIPRPSCGKKYQPYTPDDEGLPQVEWALRVAARHSKKSEDLAIEVMRLERAVQDLVSIATILDVQKGSKKILDAIKERPVVKRALGLS